MNSEIIMTNNAILNWGSFLSDLSHLPLLDENFAGYIVIIDNICPLPSKLTLLWILLMNRYTNTRLHFYQYFTLSSSFHIEFR